MSSADNAALLDMASEAVVVYDSDFRFLAANAPALAQMGLTRDVLLGQVLWDLFPETVTAYQEPLTRAMRERVPITFQAYYAPSDTWTEGRCIPMETWREWRQPALAVFFRDISSVKQAAERAESLQRVSAALVGALTPEEVAQVIVLEAMPALDASLGLVAALTEDETEFHTLGLVGYPPELAQNWQRFSADAPVPLADAVRRGKLIFLETQEERAAHYPHLTSIREAGGIGALAAVPLLAEGSALGGMVLVFRQAGPLSEENQTFLLTLARLCAQALGRARLQALAQREVEERLRAEVAQQESEQRLRLALAAGGLGTWHWNLQTGIVEWPPSTKALFGLLPDAATERSQLLQLLHPDDHLRVEQAMQVALNGGQDYDVEYRAVWPDGTVHWLASRGRVYRDAESVPTHIEGVIQNIDARKQAEETLRKSETQFRALADNITQLAWMADESGSLFWYNQRWFDYTGTTLEQVQDRGWKMVHHPDHVARVEAKFFEHVQMGQTWEDTFPLRGKDGLYRWFLSRAAPIRNEAGDVALWFGTNTDITEQLQTEAQIGFAYRREALLNRIGQTIRETRDPEQIQWVAVQALGEALGVDRAYFSLLDLVRDVSWTGRDFHRADLPSVAGTYRISDYQIDLAQYYPHGKTLVLADILTEEWPAPMQEAIHALRVRASISVPLFDGGVLVGTLAVAMADVPRVWTPDEVALLEAVAVQTRAALDAARVQEREHRIAAQLQDALQPPLPKDVPGLWLGHYTRPALDESEVGGDFFDIFPLDKGLYAIVIGDVSGKGLAAAQQLALIRNSLRTTLYLSRAPAQAVASLNAIVTAHDLLVGFVTAFVGVYDVATGQVGFVSCGHEPALVRRANGSVDALPVTGPPLGIAENSVFKESQVTLASNDTLLLYTDGISEAGPSRQALLGTEGLVHLFRDLPMEMGVQAQTQWLTEQISAYAQGIFRDDVAIILARQR